MGFSTDESVANLARFVDTQNRSTEDRLARLEDTVADLATLISEKWGRGRWRTADDDVNQAAANLADFAVAIRAERP